MNARHYFQIILKNLVIAIAAFLFIDFLVEGIFRQNVRYNPIFEYSVIFGMLAGLTAGFNELLVEKSVRKLCGRYQLTVNKVNLVAEPVHYARIFRVFAISSLICLLVILILSFNSHPLQTFMQLSFLPICLALGANVPQTYTVRIPLKGKRQEALNTIQHTLYDSVFTLEFKDHYHLNYRLENPWRYLHAYCFAPDCCCMEVVVYKEHVEITGSYRYLEAFFTDTYICGLIEKKEEQKA